MKSNPMNAILHILVYLAINVVDIVAIVQGGFCKSVHNENLVLLLEEIRLFVNQKMKAQTEKKLLKTQKRAFVFIHVILVPWLIFMSFWVYHMTGYKMFLIYALVYFNHYFTSMEVMKMLMLLQFIRHFLHNINTLFFKALNEKTFDLEVFLKTYDKLLDCVTFFNSGFGLQILGTSIVTPLVMVQAIFFNLSQIVFPSLIRTIVVNVATLIKFLLFLVSYRWFWLCFFVGVRFRS